MGGRWDGKPVPYGKDRRDVGNVFIHSAGVGELSAERINPFPTKGTVGGRECDPALRRGCHCEGFAETRGNLLRVARVFGGDCHTSVRTGSQ